MRNTEPWQMSAVCVQFVADDEIWFPGRGGSGRRAKQICSGCPVVTECLQYALDNPGIQGVWGGLTEFERRHLRNPKLS